MKRELSTGALLIVALFAFMPKVRAATLDALWEFDGNYRTTPSSAWDGVAYGSVGFVPGISGQAASFDEAFGQTGSLDFDYVDSGIPISNLDYNGGFSMTAWIKPESPLPWYGLPIVVHIYPGFGFYAGPDGRLALNLYDSTPCVLSGFTHPGRLIMDQWNHVAVTWDGSTSGGIKIYVDGVAQQMEYRNTTPCAFQGLNSANPIPLRIGASQGDSEGDMCSFKGSIDDVSIWKGVLTPSEIADFAETNYLPPVADAGEDQTVHTGAIVNLDASASHDPVGNYPLTYAWQIISRPGDSEAELNDLSGVTPWFVPDLPGDYDLRLAVTNSLGLASSPDSVRISTFNIAPAASLDALWEFDGNYRTTPSSAWDGVASGSVDFVPGVSGQAASFDEAWGPPSQDFDYVESKSISNAEYNDGLSIMAWIKPVSPLPWYGLTIVVHYPGFGFYAGPDRRLALNLYDSTYNILSGFTNPGIVTMDQWNHVAVTWDGSTTGGVKIYLDGVEQEMHHTLRNTFLGLNHTAAWPLRIGASQPDSAGTLYCLNGSMDNVSLWKGVLTKERILDEIGETSNEPPVSNANGPYTSVCQGLLTTIELDGTSSSDPDGDDLTYEWATDCPEAIIDDPTSPTPLLVIDTSSGELAECSITLTVADTSGESDSASSLAIIQPCSPSDLIIDVVKVVEVVIESNQGTPLADKMEDAAAKTQTALDEAYKTPPDNQAAVGNIEGAVGELEAAINDELLDIELGTQLQDHLTSIARQMAMDAISQAIALNGDTGKIHEAMESLTEGDDLRNSEVFKDAVNKYKDALSKAEGAL